MYSSHKRAQFAGFMARQTAQMEPLQYSFFRLGVEITIARASLGWRPWMAVTGYK